MNYSIDYSTLPSNQLSAQSYHSQGGANAFSDKNIYQTISEVAFNKQQLQLLTRNTNTNLDKRSFVAVGNHSTKKRRQGSSKERQASVVTQSVNASLLDYSNRQQSNKNIIQGFSSNPYLFEVVSGKKTIKKKSESIDFVSSPFLIVVPSVEKEEQDHA